MGNEKTSLFCVLSFIIFAVHQKAQIMTACDSFMNTRECSNKEMEIHGMHQANGCSNFLNDMECDHVVDGREVCRGMFLLSKLGHHIIMTQLKFERN